MKRTHTPGPWHLSTSGSLKPDTWKRDADGDPYQEHSVQAGPMGSIKGVAHVFLGSPMLMSPTGTLPTKQAIEEQHANAHLIAAAPDLLAALESLLETIETAQRLEGTVGEATWEEYRELVRECFPAQIRAAIAKATAEEVKP